MVQSYEGYRIEGMVSSNSWNRSKWTCSWLPQSNKNKKYVGTNYNHNNIPCIRCVSFNHHSSKIEMWINFCPCVTQCNIRLSIIYKMNSCHLRQMRMSSHHYPFIHSFIRVSIDDIYPCNNDHDIVVLVHYWRSLQRMVPMRKLTGQLITSNNYQVSSMQRQLID